MNPKERHRSLTLRGLVCPSDWDTNEQVSRVSIFTFDDDEYEVEPENAGALLLQHAGHEVMVRGQQLPGYRKRKVVLVKSFTVFGPCTAETVEGEAAPLNLRELG